MKHSIDGNSSFAILIKESERESAQKRTPVLLMHRLIHQGMTSD
jgi:hypothetical protein